MQSDLSSKHIDWFNLSEIGVYITPELICGKPCVLLLDTGLLFKEHKILAGGLDQFGFLPVDFELAQGDSQHLYVLFTDTISSDLFHKKLKIPHHNIKKFRQPLSSIQDTFYTVAEQIYNFRVDVIIKSSKLLGFNHQMHEVYDSKFGRYKITHMGSSENLKIKHNFEDRKERNISYLRAITSEDLIYCCEGFVKKALSTGRNISLSDAIRFAGVLFAPHSTSKTEFKVKPHQINLVLNVFNALYIKHIGLFATNHEDMDDFFSSIDSFKSVCLGFEACPSIPRAIYTNYLANNYNTPSPLAFIMQKLLVLGDDHTGSAKTVLDSMIGYGSLVSFISNFNFNLTGVELNRMVCQVSRLSKISNLDIYEADSTEDSAISFKKDSKPWDYTIGNPAYQISNKKFEYSDSHGSITIDRTDLISIMKDLMVRSYQGRSVYLIPYYTDDSNLQTKSHTIEIEQFLGFIGSRYNIEGISCISSEIYSKSLQKIGPLLVVIGARRNNYEVQNKLSIKTYTENSIEDYEALWDWSNLICYKRSPHYIKDKEDYQNALKSPLQTITYIDDTAMMGLESTPIQPKSLSASNSLFDFTIENESDDVEASLENNISSVEDDGSEVDDLVDDTTTEKGGDVQENLDTSNEAVDDATTNTSETHGATDTVINEFSSTQPKLNKGNVNLFNLMQKNKIIRYHSVATLSEPTSNVKQSEFAAYLKARKNLGVLISSAFDQHFPLHKQFIDKLIAYLNHHNLDPSSEAFVSAHLGFKNPRICTNALLPEHIDLLASSIIKLTNNESLMVLDSVGMDSTTALVALTKFAQEIGKGVVYCVKDNKSIDGFLSRLYSLSGTFDLTEYDIRYVFDADEITSAFSDFTKRTIVFVVDSAKNPLVSKSISPKTLPPNDQFLSFVQADMDGRKPSSSLITHILKSPTIFLASEFINPETDINTLNSLFTKDMFNRFFSPGFGDLDEMSCHLLKIGMIENLSLLQRLEDLSKISMIDNEEDNVWTGKYEVLAGSFSSALNNIALLSEMIHAGKSNSNVQTSLIREQAIQIFELCSFCINSVPITYSVYRAIKNNSKPVVVMPKNIEGLLYSILEKLNVDFVKHHNHSYINNFAELNSTIINLDNDLKRNDEYDEQQMTLLESYSELIAWRTTLINNYFTSQKRGTYSKYPDLTGIISAFYAYCCSGLNSEHEHYDTLYQKCKDIEIEISSLVDLPICVADFMQYELNEHQIRTAEISSRTFALEYSKESEKWIPSLRNPSVVRRKTFNDENVIQDGFNRGDYDVLFVEADEISGLDFSSKKLTNDIVSDHMRKRCLILTYFNKPIDHYLSIIGSVNSNIQETPADILFEVPAMPSQQTLANIIRQQLELYNVKNTTPQDYDLTYYLTADGKQLLHEYLSLNPSYLAHRPNLPIKNWDIYTVLDVINMVGSAPQLNIIEHLHHFVKHHLMYLRVTKKNPFDVFAISPKTNFDSIPMGDDITYLNKRLNSHDDSFAKPIKCASLSYAKTIKKPLTLDECKRLRIESISSEKARIKGLLVGQFSVEIDLLDSLSYSDLFGLYVTQFSGYLISTYRDRIATKLQDRYKNWIFHNQKKINKLNFIKNHFSGSKGLRVSSSIQGLYMEILMLGDLELVKSFEDSCAVLTFLKAYQISLQKIETAKLDSLIVLPVSSPFSDRSQTYAEGFLTKLNLPGSLMTALTPKSFSVSVAYPLKSKVTDLNLAYILESPDVLSGQSILTNFKENELKVIYNAYSQGKYLDVLKNKLSMSNFDKIIGFSTSDCLGASSFLIKGFAESSTGQKIRNLNVFYGNLFEIYRLLKDIVPLTLVSFINEKSLTQYGFLIPSDVDPGFVIDSLIRVVAPGNLPSLYKYFQTNKTNLKYIRSIDFYGSFGSLLIGQMGRDTISVTFSGTESELQSLFLDKDLFIEYISPSEKLNMDKITKSKSQVSNNIAKFIPLDISKSIKRVKGVKRMYSFSLDQDQVDGLLATVCSKKLYNLALLDCTQKNDRIQLSLKINP